MELACNRMPALPAQARADSRAVIASSRQISPMPAILGQSDSHANGNAIHPQHSERPAGPTHPLCSPDSQPCRLAEDAAEIPITPDSVRPAAADGSIPPRKSYRPSGWTRSRVCAPNQNPWLERTIPMVQRPPRQARASRRVCSIAIQQVRPAWEGERRDRENIPQ